MLINLSRTAHSQAFTLDYECSSIEYRVSIGKRHAFADVNYDKGRTALVEKELERLLLSGDSIQEPVNLHGGYFIVLVDEERQSVSCFRDPSGIKSGYYYRSGQQLIIGTNTHYIAKKAGIREFNPLAVRMLLSLEYLYDGLTIYKDLHEVEMGGRLVFGSGLDIAHSSRVKLHLHEKDNSLSWDGNVKQLRENIVQAHARVAGSGNIVLLSGGIDSCVMLAALDEIKDSKSIHTLSYRVKGTKQDETVYARSIADHLGHSNELVEVDPSDPACFRDFGDRLLKMNNPYIGMWIFSLNDASSSDNYYAGQDTRLHTPDVHPLDDFVFSLVKHRSNPLLKAARVAMSPLNALFFKTPLKNSGNKYVRNFDRVLTALDVEEYLLKYFFKLHPEKLEKIGIPFRDYGDIKRFFRLDLSAVRNKRHLYNLIVNLKWREQYTDDIRYLQDMGKMCGTYIQMPFYDPQLAEFSSGIPYEWASKYTRGRDQFDNSPTMVNKLLLREAFRDKLNDTVYYRKKAVSVTNFLLFNGVLGDRIREYLQQDLASSTSFLREHGLEAFAHRFLRGSNWELLDQPFLLRIYYTGVLCYYYNRINH
jgi:asparagine synthetase B (glutamine-hydrolysing)